MPRKVVGRFTREMNTESVNDSGPKTRAGAKLRERRTVSEPRSKGIGGIYRANE